MKTASKCLARMTGCWNPEFEPSVEEIVDYPMIYGDSLSSLSLASSLSGGISLYSVEHVAGEGQLAQAARPNIIRVYEACAVCQCVLV